VFFDVISQGRSKRTAGVYEIKRGNMFLIYFFPLILNTIFYCPSLSDWNIMVSFRMAAGTQLLLRNVCAIHHE